MSAVLFIFLFLFTSETFSASAGPSLWLRRDLHKLEVLGFIGPRVTGVWPLPNRELQKRIEEGRASLSQCSQKNPGCSGTEITAGKKFLDDIDNGIPPAVRPPPGWYLHPAERVKLNSELSDRAVETALVNNGLGGLKSSLSSSPPETFSFPKRATWITEISTVASLGLSETFAMILEPIASLSLPQYENSSSSLSLSRGFVASSLGPVHLEFGRDYLIWGHSPTGGLILSANAGPLDQLRIDVTRDAWPGLTTLVDDFELSGFFARLEGDRDFPYALLMGYRPALRLKSFEMGLTHTLMMFGGGATKGKWYQHLAEYFCYQQPSDNFADHHFGIDLSWTIPSFHSMQIYSEGYWEDLGTEALFSNFGARMSYLLGLYLPLLTDDGGKDLRFEWRFLSPLGYRNFARTSGYTYKERTLGAPLGPDSQQLSATMGTTLVGRNRVEIELQYSRLSRDLYRNTNDFTVVSIQEVPKEVRWGATLGYSFFPMAPLNINLTGGIETITNFESNEGQHRMGYRISTQAEWKL